MQKKLAITVSPGGDVKIEGVGFAGEGCLEASAAFEAALKGKVESRVEKPEMHQVAEAAENTIGTQHG